MIIDINIAELRQQLATGAVSLEQLKSQFAHPPDEPGHERTN
jgi:hypothetical protein